MKPLTVILSALLAAKIVQADPYSMAVQQAKRVADQNNAQQQAMNQQPSTPPPAAPPPQSSATAPDPALEATLKNISNLGADIAAFVNSTNAEVLPARKQTLTNDLTAAATGAKPSADLIQKLADDLVTTVAGKPKLIAQQTKLGRDIHAIFNSSHLSTGQQYSVVNEVQKILIENGAAAEDVNKLLDDLKAIEAATR